METEINMKFRMAYESVVNGFEGMYANDKDDPGGETYKGIARNKNKDFEGWKIIDGLRGNKDFPEVLERENALQGSVMEFYKKNYWDKFKGDYIGEETGEELFDQSVNMGVSRAVEHMQRSLNVLNDRERLYNGIKVDGIFGGETESAYIACCHERSEKWLVNYMNAYQGKYYLELMEKRTIFEKFTGLLKRVTIK